MNKVKTSLLIILFIFMSVNISTANESISDGIHELSYSENMEYQFI